LRGQFLYDVFALRTEKSLQKMEKCGQFVGLISSFAVELSGRNFLTKLPEFKKRLISLSRESQN